MGLIAPDRNSKFFTLRKKFIIASGSLVCGYLAAYIGLSHLADDSETHLSRTGMDNSDIKELTTASVNFHSSDTIATYLYSLTNLSSDHITESYRNIKKVNSNGQVTSLQPSASRHPGFTKGSFIDKLTLGLSSKIFPCAIHMPSENIDMDDIKKLITVHNAERVINFPGNMEDYLKIITYHELGHCDQPRSFSEDTLVNEYDVDRKAIQKFLNDGGNPDVAKAAIYGRVIQGVLNSDYYTQENPVVGPVMGPAFASEFLDSDPMSYNQSVKGFRQIKDMLPQKAKEAEIDYFGGDRNATIRLIDYILEHSSEDLSYEALTILGLYKQAYEFFMGPYDSSAPEFKESGIYSSQHSIPESIRPPA